MKITEVYRGGFDNSKDDIDEKIKWLRWIMDFSNADLNEIGEEEKWDHRLMFWTFIHFYFRSFKNIWRPKYVEHVKRTWNSESLIDVGKGKDNESQMIFLQQFFQKALELILLELRTEKIDVSHEDESKANFGLMLGYTYRPAFRIYPDKFKLDYTQIPEPIENPQIIFQVREKDFFYKIDDVLPNSGYSASTIFNGKKHDDESGKNYLYGFHVEDQAREGGNLFEPEEIELFKFLKTADEKFAEFSIRHLDIMHKFFKLLNGIPVTWIRICKGCGKYFLHTTAREKSYCSTHCGLRSVARKKYEEIKKDPKKYAAHLAYHRKLSRERYKNIRRKQFGPNVRINRRKNRKEK